MTHGEPETYPRIADVLGFCRAEDMMTVAEAVCTIQRDWGDRRNRKHARLKYTLDDHGADAFRAEIGKRAGKPLERRGPLPSPRPATATAGHKARTASIT
jgi:sulfite reductase (NADPH) hemoprotein beta-component